MVTITVNVDDRVASRFRKVAWRVFGKHKGSLGKAVSEALTDWSKKREKDAYALIAATMFENNCFEILTENVKEFKKIPGITAVNPFKRTR
ncbi:MAG: hypothetical protein ACE5DI_04280 [Candidatus Micrarchaeia archaeon]